jgi:WD40 repeat protein
MGKRYITGSLDETIRGWCVATGEEIYHSWTEGVLGAVTCLQWQPGTECFISSHESFNSFGSSAPSILIHAAGREVRPEFELQRSVNKIAVSSTGRFLAAATGEDVMVFDLRRGSTSNVTLKKPDLCLGVRFSKDGSCIYWHRVVIGVGAFGISAWNLSTWKDQDLEECNTPENAYPSQHYAWLGIRGESVLKSLADNRIVARYPESLENPASHPNLPMWAQCIGTYVEVVSLDIAGTIV